MLELDISTSEKNYPTLIIKYEGKSVDRVTLSGRLTISGREILEEVNQLAWYSAEVDAVLASFPNGFNPHKGSSVTNMPMVNCVWARTFGEKYLLPLRIAYTHFTQDWDDISPNFVHISAMCLADYLLKTGTARYMPNYFRLTSWLETLIVETAKFHQKS